jgi:hypothetical protein
MPEYADQAPRHLGRPERFVVEPNPDGGYTARKPGVYGIQAGNGLGDGFVPLFEVKEPPGKPLPNRRDRREQARQAARQLNRGRRRRVVAVQPDDRVVPWVGHGRQRGDRENPTGK